MLKLIAEMTGIQLGPGDSTPPVVTLHETQLRRMIKVCIEIGQQSWVFLAEIDQINLSTELQFAFFKESGRLYLADYLTTQLSALHLPAGKWLTIDRLFRIPGYDDGGMFYRRFVMAGERALLLYEAGLVCFDNSGRIVWHTIHDRADLFLESVSSEAIVYTDPEGVRHIYDPSTGACREPRFPNEVIPLVGRGYLKFSRVSSQIAYYDSGMRKVWAIDANPELELVQDAVSEAVLASEKEMVRISLRTGSRLPLS